MLTTLAVITATVVGVMVGVEFAVAVFVNPILLRLPAGPSLEARAHGARALARVMPFCYSGSLLLTAWLPARNWIRPAGAPTFPPPVLPAVTLMPSYPSPAPPPHPPP